MLARAAGCRAPPSVSPQNSRRRLRPQEQRLLSASPRKPHPTRSGAAAQGLLHRVQGPLLPPRRPRRPSLAALTVLLHAGRLRGAHRGGCEQAELRCRDSNPSAACWRRLRDLRRHKQLTTMWALARPFAVFARHCSTCCLRPRRSTMYLQVRLVPGLRQSLWVSDGRVAAFPMQALLQSSRAPQLIEHAVTQGVSETQCSDCHRKVATAEQVSRVFAAHKQRDAAATPRNQPAQTHCKMCKRVTSTGTLPTQSSKARRMLCRPC